MAAPGRETFPPPDDGTQPSEAMEAPKPKTTTLWATFLVLVVLIIASGGYLVYRSSNPSTPQFTTQPAPSQETTIAPTTEPPATADVYYAEGDTLLGIEDCGGAAIDASGFDTYGSYYSADGLAMKALDGYEAEEMQLPWIYGSNTQMKTYEGTEWVSFLQVGRLEADNGFVAAQPSAVRLAQCLIGSDFYPDTNSGTVLAQTSGEEGHEYFGVKIPAPPNVEGIDADAVFIHTIEIDEVMHVALGTVSADDEEDMAAILDAISTLQYPA